MAATPRILAFAGSTRAGSFNRLLLGNAARGARDAGAEVTEIDLRDYPLPLFDQDLEAEEGAPDAAKRLKALFLSHGGLLIASPEYNSSITGVLKNALDWVSRPAPGEASLACFRGKAAAILSASPGTLGGLRGLATLRSILGNIGVLLLPDQVAVPQAQEAFLPDGRLKDEKRRAAVEGLGGALARLTSRLAS
ncbi:MAG: NADPH-dependent FMN reductase [Planctomycetaceae bacterium]